MKKVAIKEQIDRHYELWCATTRFYENWAKQRGITYNIVLALCTLQSNQEHCTQKMICEQWGLPKQTVNDILKDFEKKGFVTFTCSLSDKRNKLILLTDRGKEYADEIATELYSLDYYSVEKMGLDRMTQFNDNIALYLKYSREAYEGKTQ